MCDEAGNTTVVRQGVAFTVVTNAGYEYDAAGCVTNMRYRGVHYAKARSAVGNRYLWQGREYSWATGLYYFRARWYDPVTGRWLSKDPIGLSGGLNQYAVCANDPVNFRDPLGLLTWSQVGNFAAGVAIGAGVAVVVVVTAPVVASAGAAALVAAGVSAATAGTIATATVSGGLLVAGGYGAYTTGVNIYQNAVAGNWDAVAFDAGTLVGGVAVGVGGRPSGGRALAEGMMGRPSPAPNTWNPFRVVGYEWANRYQPSMGPPGAKYFATSPTPASGGAAAAGIAGGIGSSLYPSQSSDPYK